MNQKNQDEIDSLLNSFEQESTDASDKDQGQATLEDSVDSKDTGESVSNQEKNSGEIGNNEGKGVPWVDFIPKYAGNNTEDKVELMQVHFDNVSDMLRDKELLKLSYLEKLPHQSYYKSWVQDSNIIFKSLVRHRYRKKAAKSGKPLKEF